MGFWVLKVNEENRRVRALWGFESERIACLGRGICGIFCLF